MFINYYFTRCGKLNVWKWFCLSFGKSKLRQPKFLEKLKVSCEFFFVLRRFSFNKKFYSPALSPLLRQCNELTSEMVHFIRQTQYYFLFEVLECSWNQLIEQVHQAESLDEVISAHQQFLLTVKAGVFRDEYHEVNYFIEANSNQFYSPLCYFRFRNYRISSASFII